MLTLNDALILVSRSIFLLLGFVTIRGYLKYRDQAHRDIALMFNSMAISVAISILNTILEEPNTLLATVGSIAFMAQPYLLLRLLSYFSPVSNRMKVIAFMGLVASWLIIVINLGIESSPITSLIIIFYFVIVDGYAMTKFIRSAFRTTGLLQQRLRLIAIGSGMLALILGLLGIPIVIPELAAPIGTLVQFGAIISIVMYFGGLAPPRWLYRYWQLNELQKFLSNFTRYNAPDSLTQAAEVLCNSIVQSIGGIKGLVLIWDEQTDQWIYSESESSMTDCNPIITNWLASQEAPKNAWIVNVSDMTMDLQKCLQLEHTQNIYLVPLRTNSDWWSVLLIFVDYTPLFTNDDLQLIDLVKEQGGTIFENINLLDTLRVQNENLEERVIARTTELRRSNEFVTLLQEVTVATNQTQALSTAFQEALNLICPVLDMPIGHVFAPSDDFSQQFESSSIWYVQHPDRFKSFISMTESLAFDDELGGIRQVLSSKEAFWTTDLQDKTKFTRAEIANEVGICTGIFIPVRQGNEVLAIIEMFSDKMIEQNSEIVSLLNSIGTQLVRVVERTVAEKELRESEARFRIIANAAPIPLVISSLAGGEVLYANEASTVIHGISVDEFIGQKAPDLYENPQDRQKLIAELQEHGSVRNFELKVRRASDNEVFWASTTIHPIEFEGQGALFSTFLDVTEIKKAHQSLIESEQRFRSTFEQAAVGVAHVSLEGQFMRINQRFADIIGYSKEDVLSLTFQEITHPDDLEADLKYVRQVIEGKINNYSIEKRYFHRDQSIVWINLTVSAVYDEINQPKYLIAVVEDITNRKQMELEIRALNEDLEQRVRERTAHLSAVNKELEAFSYSVSHDLRAPLRAVDGFSQALLEDYHDVLDDFGKRYLDLLRKESQRMGRLIDDLIDLSRLTRADLKYERLSLSSMVQTLADELKQTYPNREAEFVIEKDLCDCGDPRLIQIALDNLVGNAWKYSSKETKVIIEFGQILNNGAPEYFIRDNGVGFDMAYVHKLFGAFQRLHAMNEFEGTGIGLATVQRVVHRHGGTIRAEGELDKGATFYFTLGEANCD